MLNQLKNELNDWAETKTPFILTKQDNFFNTNNNYFQGLSTHSVVPSHTATIKSEIAPDSLNSIPSDKTHSWIDFMPELSGVKTSGALEIHEYSNNNGNGFVILLRMKFKGDEYIKAWNFGHETGKSFDWHKIINL